MMLRRKFKHGKIYRLLALTSYYGRTLEEISPKYLAHEISMLMEYQTKATRFYQKSVELDKRRRRSAGRSLRFPHLALLTVRSRRKSGFQNESVHWSSAPLNCARMRPGICGRAPERWAH